MLGNSSRILRLRIEPMSQQEMCWTNCLLEVAIKFILSLSFSIHKLRCVLNTSISYLPLHNAKHYFLLLLHIIIWLGDLSKGKHKCYPLPPQQCLLNFFLYSQLCVCVCVSNLTPHKTTIVFSSSSKNVSLRLYSHHCLHVPKFQWRGIYV